MASEAMSDERLLAAAGRAVGVELAPDQIARMLRLRDLLLEWNQRVNLTAIVEPRAVLALHLIDSLACLVGCDPRAGDARVLDMGSGAGFPALVLAIARPDWRVASLEATGKKVRFQQAAIADLDLTNITATQGRAEDLTHDPAWRGRFDVVVARAVAALPVLLEWLQPFARVGGVTLAPKKGDLTAELAGGARAAAILGGAPPEPLALPVALTTLSPELADGRVIVRVRQLSPAPARFARPHAATIKDPLGRTR